MVTNIKFIIGVDEVGRGALAGPVGVCAFLISAGANLFKLGISDVRDSKQLSARQRDEWFFKINELKKSGFCFYAVTFVRHSTIDRLGISAAVRLGVKSALSKLSIEARECEVLLDGLLRAPKIFENQHTIIKGDESEPTIALASIVAKVIRDHKMARLAKKYPHYGFERHKGYGTNMHYSRLQKHGISDAHRHSFCKKLEIL